MFNLIETINVFDNENKNIEIKFRSSIKDLEGFVLSNLIMKEDKEDKKEKEENNNFIDFLLEINKPKNLYKINFEKTKKEIKISLTTREFIIFIYNCIKVSKINSIDIVKDIEIINFIEENKETNFINLLFQQLKNTLNSKNIDFLPSEINNFNYMFLKFLQLNLQSLFRIHYYGIERDYTEKNLRIISKLLIKNYNDYSIFFERFFYLFSSNEERIEYGNLIKENNKNWEYNRNIIEILLKLFTGSSAFYDELDKLIDLEICKTDPEFSKIISQSLFSRSSCIIKEQIKDERKEMIKKSLNLYENYYNSINLNEIVKQKFQELYYFNGLSYNELDLFMLVLMLKKENDDLKEQILYTPGNLGYKEAENDFYSKIN